MQWHGSGLVAIFPCLVPRFYPVHRIRRPSFAIPIYYLTRGCVVRVGLWRGFGAGLLGGACCTALSLAAFTIVWADVLDVQVVFLLRPALGV